MLPYHLEFLSYTKRAVFNIRCRFLPIQNNKVKKKVVLQYLYIQSKAHLYHFSMQNFQCPQFTAFLCAIKSAGDIFPQEDFSIVSEILSQATDSSLASFDDIGLFSSDNLILNFATLLFPYLPVYTKAGWMNSGIKFCKTF